MRAKQFLQEKGYELATPELMEEYASSKWISVDDELPESPTRYVLGFIEDGPGIIKTTKTITRKDELWQFVTYWQPVPSPPN